ncbi:MAG: valine--tRNA ligase, partial [Candidatus Methylomirabilales bacterium]
MTKGYTPQGVEERWYAFWEEKGYFQADEDSPKPPYCIVIPPPNITGSLHMGHALNNTLQDVLIRFKRMEGRNVLWVPGTDHAGIATQNIIERQLREEGLTREQLGREAFLQRVWRWKEEAVGIIIAQLKRLGASCDWRRECFTMDEARKRAVLEVFVRLFEDGLLYRAERLVNWCPRCETALADIEVIHEETEGSLWFIRYPFADDPQKGLVVATTRPETMLADTAVAVNPEDERYRAFVGKRVLLPLVGRRLPVIADPYVSQAFGTGALKVTPGHDPNDFEIGRRHHLMSINAFSTKASLTEAFLIDEEGRHLENPRAARYVGKDRYEVRRMVLQDLREEGLLVKEEPHRLALGSCYRCQTTIEPYLTPQWFIRMRPLAEPAVKAVEEGRVRIIPPQWEKNYFDWMNNIRDWCISRQIWWGHRIPAWYCLRCDQAHLPWVEGLSEPGERVYFIRPEAHPIVAKEKPSTCPRCGGAELIQDPDVLDTWFSSALWPFSTLGWPEKTKALQVFYPTSCLVTSFDILFFWVARMIMMGLKFMGDVPFKDVYIHALVRDAEGQKMSKSKGNVIDPLDMIDRYGADALRFTLVALAAQGRDIRLSEERFEGYRHFCNKLWNAYRFVAMHLGSRQPPAISFQPSDLPKLRLADRWVLSRLQGTIAEVTGALEGYRFNEAASAIYQFIWHEYCDWYLEVVKPSLQPSADTEEKDRLRSVLAWVLEVSLRLLHPFMPFITEEIWQRLPHHGES